MVKPYASITTRSAHSAILPPRDHIQDVTASVIQAAFRGYRVRKSFQEKMNLMIQHDQLRKESQLRRKARAEAQQRSVVAGGSLVEDGESRDQVDASTT